MQQKLKKRPKRPCVYCGQMQSQLARHLRRHHKNEKAVSELTTMKDDKDKNFVFSRIRKSGILRENKKRAKCTENPDFVCERQQGDTDLVICGTCSGFFSRKKCGNTKQITVTVVKLVLSVKLQYLRLISLFRLMIPG